MKKRNPEERLLHAYEHAFLCLFVIALLAFTALFLHLLGYLGHPTAELQAVSPLAALSVWGLGITVLYKGLRWLFIHLTRPALGKNVDKAYSKKVTV